MKRSTLLKHRVGPGQSLSEYSFAIELVSVVAIASVVALGSNVSDLFSNMITPRTAGSPTLQGPLTVSSPSTTVATAPALPGMANLQLTLSDGSTLQIANDPFNTAELVDLAGLDGTTQKYAQSINDFAAQLLEAGKIDATQAGLLRKLADQGFNLGLGQQNLLQQRKNAKNTMTSPAQLNSAYVFYSHGTFDREGVTISTSQIQDYVDNPRKPIPLNTHGGTYLGLNQAYDDVEKSGILNDPAIRQIVDHSYDEILRANFAVLLEGKLEQDAFNASGSTRAAQHILADSPDFNTTVGAAIRKTQKNSNDICTTGHGDGRSLVRCVAKG